MLNETTYKSTALFLATVLPSVLVWVGVFFNFAHFVFLSGLHPPPKPMPMSMRHVLGVLVVSWTFGFFCRPYLLPGLMVTSGYVACLPVLFPLPSARSHTERILVSLAFCLLNLIAEFIQYDTVLCVRTIIVGILFGCLIYPLDKYTPVVYRRAKVEWARWRRED